MNVTLLIICSLLAGGCQEDVHSTYATLVELDHAGQGARTWFPEVLPTSASNLEVWYNIDTNATVGRLRFDPSELEPFRGRLTAQRQDEPFAEAKFPMMDDVDWPPCLKGSVALADVRACGYEAIRIPGFQIVIDPRGSLYFWTP
jgi:hypothetical protein